MWKHVSAEMSVARARGSNRRPGFIDSCHAFASDGEVVRKSWPEFYAGDEGHRGGERRKALRFSLPRRCNPLVVIPAKEDVKESDFTDFVGPD